MKKLFFAILSVLCAFGAYAQLVVAEQKGLDAGGNEASGANIFDRKAVDDDTNQILQFVEQLRTAYCQKDKKLLEDLFSEDALIITGHVRQRKSLEPGIGHQEEFTKQTKCQYLNKLFKKFGKSKNDINVRFDDIEVEHSPVNPDMYGVTLRQEMTSKNYTDAGTVFLLLDFTDTTAPNIMVYAWQPLAHDSGNAVDTHKFQISEFVF